MAPGARLSGVGVGAAPGLRLDRAAPGLARGGAPGRRAPCRRRARLECRRHRHAHHGHDDAHGTRPPGHAFAQ